MASDLAEDSLSVGFASPWAGCNWYSFAEGGTPAAEWDAITFGKLAKLAEDHPDLCEKIPFCSVWDLPKSDAESEPWFKDLVFDVSRSLLPLLVLNIVLTLVAVQKAQIDFRPASGRRQEVWLLLQVLRPSRSQLHPSSQFRDPCARHPHPSLSSLFHRRGLQPSRYWQSLPRRQR